MIVIIVIVIGDSNYQRILETIKHDKAWIENCERSIRKDKTAASREHTVFSNLVMFCKYMRFTNKAAENKLWINVDGPIWKNFWGLLNHTPIHVVTSFIDHNQARYDL